MIVIMNWRSTAPPCSEMDSGNHQRHEKAYQGVLRAYYAMPHNGRYIWGATAGILKSLYDRLYGA